jgi:aminoglycoside 6'-N-acetyltransferase I
MIDHIKNWYFGTEYYIDELCIQTDKQGNGVGTYFLKEIEKAIKEHVSFTKQI